MNRITDRLADITIKSFLSSGLALGLALMCLLSSPAKAGNWEYSVQVNDIDGLSRYQTMPLMTLKISAGTNQWNNIDVNAS